MVQTCDPQTGQHLIYHANPIYLNKTEIAFSPYIPARIQYFYLHTKPTGQIVSRTRLSAYGRAELWSGKTGTRLPAYCRTRLLAYGQTRLPGKTICRTICRTMAGLDCWPGIAYQCNATQIDANIDATHNPISHRPLQSKLPLK
jgi:hypothetical protein